MGHIVSGELKPALDMGLGSDPDFVTCRGFVLGRPGEVMQIKLLRSPPAGLAGRLSKFRPTCPFSGNMRHLPGRAIDPMRAFTNLGQDALSPAKFGITRVVRSTR